MHAEWLTERCTSLDAQENFLHDVDELELSENAKRSLLRNSEQLRKWSAEKWQPFLTDLLEGDQVWRFRSPDSTWQQFCGCAGYAVVRQEEIIRTLVTMHN